MNESSLSQVELRSMSKLTHNILGAIDYKNVRKKRESNYALLEESLGYKNKLFLSFPSGPYAYPLYCENGMYIKKLLAQKKIFIATLWPNVLNMENSLEKDYAQNILPLPCDQRYDEKDIQFIVEEVMKCIN